MNKFAKIITGILLSLLVLVLSSVIEISFNNFLPIGIGSQIGILIFSILLILIFTKTKIIEFKITSLKINQLWLPLTLVVILSTILQLTTLFFGNDNHPFASSMSILQTFFFIIILASLAEELLFRGFLLKMLNPLKIYGISFFKIKINLAIIISGILFGLIHFALIGNASLNYVITIVISSAFLGILAGYFQEKHNNFAFAFIIHATANLIGLIISNLK